MSHVDPRLADHLLRRLAEAHLRAASMRSQELRAEMVWEPAERCQERKCRWRFFNVNKEGALVCGHCGADWMKKLVRARGKARRTELRWAGEPEALIDASTFSLWAHKASQAAPRAVELLWIYVLGRVTGERALAFIAGERWPDDPHPWTRHRIRNELARGRRAIIASVPEAWWARAGIA
jgi:hypothetical protein